ncbi:protein of unknown function [Xenorhabdus poinarii G6]|uniref:Uncharacterized protein n=1 Tax=Xenorhabdus poinarii G6 TaxID=1354304 RepID=A0A068R9W9_9GAMM|nr:protein of unknown function [Xenorhabdus poinarii G6]
MLRLIGWQFSLFIVFFDFYELDDGAICKAHAAYSYVGISHFSLILILSIFVASILISQISLV